MIFAAALVLLVVISGFSQDLQSPEQFLGYKVGTRFTRHHKLVEYFRAVAQAKPDMVKLEKYGETNEGRELVLAFIASPENLKRLETIRTGNLSLTGLLKDKSKVSTESAPAIVWLSYNVHGNEASSSEAALLTLYALVDPSNAQTKEWLKNTVVVMDPCINPDGRDRYVNWYNSMVGKNFSADPAAREHSEPWPGGMTFHVSSRSFFQVNPSAAQKLLSLGVARAAALTGKERVLDLFCGCGAMSLPLIGDMASLLGIDSCEDAIRDAARAARDAGVSNKASFRLGDLTTLDSLLMGASSPPRFDVVIVDPARAGLSPRLISFLRSCGTQRLVYVSCNPATQARDLKALCAASSPGGSKPFALQWVMPFDLFPMTGHIEAVACLTRTTCL